jgi:hypothetical protein
VHIFLSKSKNSPNFIINTKKLPQVAAPATKRSPILLTHYTEKTPRTVGSGWGAFFKDK